MRQFLNPAPGVRVPEPEVLEVPVRRRDETGRYFYVPAPAMLRRQRLHEVHLALYDLDLADGREIDRFVATYGRLGMARFSFSSPMPGSRAAREWTWPPEATGAEINFLGFPDGGGGPLLKLLRDQRVLLDQTFVAEDEAHDFPWGYETVAEFLHGASLMKDLITAWRWINEGGKPPADGWHAALWQGKTAAQPPRDRAEAAKFLRDHVDEGLEFFPPGLALKGGLRSPWDLRPARQEEHLPVYPIACLQLANHILEGAKYRKCARTDCDRTFFRQEGRARYGQHRVQGDRPDFHHARCANTQLRRDARGSRGRRPRRGKRPPRAT